LCQESGWSNKPTTFPSPRRGEGGGEGDLKGDVYEEERKNESVEGGFEEKECKKFIEKIER